MTITEFLEARIAEVEAVARLASEDDYTVENGLRWGEVGYEMLPDLTIDPARILARCEADRLLVGRLACSDAPACGDHDCEVVVDTWRILAAMYAGHPDYDEAWRP